MIEDIEVFSDEPTQRFYDLKVRNTDTLDAELTRVEIKNTETGNLKGSWSGQVTLEGTENTSDGEGGCYIATVPITKTDLEDGDILRANFTLGFTETENGRWRYRDDETQENPDTEPDVPNEGDDTGGGDDGDTGDGEGENDTGAGAGGSCSLRAEVQSCIDERTDNFGGVATDPVTSLICFFQGLWNYILCVLRNFAGLVIVALIAILGLKGLQMSRKQGG